jgi:hypothetical protein
MAYLPSHLILGERALPLVSQVRTPLTGPSERLLVYAIDDALSSHEDPELFTAIWEFADAPFPSELMDDVARVPLPLSIRLP